LPGKRIPMWFKHHVYGHDASINFWFRKKIPAISLCLVVRPGTFEEIIQPRFIINRKRKTDVFEPNFDDSDHVHNRVADHIIIFDIKQIPLDSQDVIFEKNWNLVVCTLSGLRNKPFIDKIGISVFKQGINMEDIRFTCPPLLKGNYRALGLPIELRSLKFMMDWRSDINRRFHRQPMHGRNSLVKLLRYLKMMSWNGYQETYRFFCYVHSNYFLFMLSIFFCAILVYIFFCATLEYIRTLDRLYLFFSPLSAFVFLLFKK